MATNRSRRTRKLKPKTLGDDWRYFLETGSLPDFGDRAEIFRLMSPRRRADLRELWNTHRVEILANWKKRRKPGLPWAATQFDEKP
jgi:hypothetical protein